MDLDTIRDCERALDLSTSRRGRNRDLFEKAYKRREELRAAGREQTAARAGTFLGDLSQLVNVLETDSALARAYGEPAHPEHERQRPMTDWEFAEWCDSLDGFDS